MIDSSSWPCRVCIADVAQEGVLANKAESCGRYLDNVDTTGSSRKNDKSNPVFRGTNFNKSSVFSAVLDQELAANSSSRAPRSITITRWHP